jgi:hypothetical protein
MATPGGRRAPIRVAIVSAKPETLADLGGYLDGVGLEARRIPRLELVSELAPRTAAVIFFPDDFASEAVLATVAAIAELEPRVLPVLVTRQPQRYEHVVAGAKYVLVVPRPVWAWAIYDAIREHLARHVCD